MYEKYMEVIVKSALFSGMDSSLAESLLEYLQAQLLQCEKNQYILTEGDTVHWIGMLVSGSAGVIQEDFWGNRHIVSMLGPGQLFAEVFAFMPENGANVSVKAETETVYLKLETDRLLEPFDTAGAYQSRLLQNLLVILSGKCAAMNEKLTHMAKRTIREKVLSYLSVQSLRCGSDSFEIPFDRQQLADYLSVDRSALSSVLSKLRAEHKLDFNKNHFHLLHSFGVHEE